MQNTFFIPDYTLRYIGLP
ncbi:hypothetical protein GW922_02295 [Candidatus Pacearchaeota archaeon]|nr:hypothetical protein [Candidatus Pacearchaeota archaeon]